MSLFRYNLQFNFHFVLIGSFPAYYACWRVCVHRNDVRHPKKQNCIRPKTVQATFEYETYTLLSMTRSQSIPRTLSSGSTTALASGFGPILHVPTNPKSWIGEYNTRDIHRFSIRIGHRLSICWTLTSTSKWWSFESATNGMPISAPAFIKTWSIGESGP